MTGNISDRQTILFCGPIDQPLNSGRYMISGMQQLGFEVIGYDYRSHENYEKDLRDIVRNRKPDYVFTLKGEKISPQLIEDFKQTGCKTILWLTTSILEDWMPSFAKANDYVVTNTEDMQTLFTRHGVKKIKWITQGFAPDFFGITGPESGKKNPYYAQTAMIGSMGYPIYKKRCELVTLLRKNDVDIKWWGPRLARQIKNIPFFLGGVHRSWAGKEVYMKDFADVIRNVKIFIGQDADIPVSGLYLSNRIFAVTGCGGFYLGRKTPGIEAAFEIGKEVDVFESDAELLEKIKFYLQNEDQRAQIALAGQKKVLTHYTYKQQIKKIFDWISENEQE
ncbi:MAG TPA: glycosyltransferase [Smithella sp.]|nr:glycosyltransferase [Smithella sp.]HNY51182.1 glycosyltransferase [Smithella sp.]HOU51683.1 glycosyltransferase [Smithella sp.]HQG66473.1 glycosyltransferase [Smithella sp.]HQI73143.1 glycosyltransferase [Smithella sp.]